MADIILQTFDLNDLNVNNISNDLFESTEVLAFKNMPIEENTRVCVAMHKSLLYITIDANLWLITDLEHGSVGYHQKFEHPIDAMHLAGDHLLIGLCNGTIHLLDVTSGDILGSVLLHENVWYEVQFIIGIYEEPSDHSFYVILRNGGIYKIIQHVKPHSIESALVWDLHLTVTSAYYANNRCLIAGNETVIVDFCDKCVDDIIIEKGIRFVQLQAMNEGFLARKSDNSLALISACNLSSNLPLDNIEDFVYYELKRKSYLYYYSRNDETVKLEENTYEKREIFSIQAENFYKLIPTQDDDENQAYLSCTPNKLVVHVVQQTKPVERLQRLIRMQRFAEAEAFAAQYDLGREQIEKAKVSSIAGKEQCDDADIDNMLELMRRINDVDFIVASLLQTSCTTMHSMQKLLGYVQSLNLGDISDANMDRIFSRFEMYTALMRCSDETEDINLWHALTDEKFDTFTFLITNLRRRDLEPALIAFDWLEKADFTWEHIELVLNCLNNLPVDEYVSFLISMVPRTLLHLPSAIPIFVKRVINNVYVLETRNDDVYPEQAILLVDQTLGIFTAAIAGESCHNMEVDHQINELGRVSKCLQTILELKNNYNLYLPLHTALEGPAAMLQFFLKLRSTYIETFLKEFLIGFMSRNGFKSDEILAEEVRNLIKYDEAFWIRCVPSVWRCIGAAGARLEVLLDILKASPKPWSGEIRDILYEALKLNHPLVASVQTEADNEPLYTVLHRSEYGLKHKCFRSVKQDTYIVQRIIYCNLPTLADDVYTLCKTDECRATANFLMVTNFIMRGEITRVLALVRSHTSEEMSRYARRVVTFFLDKAIDDNRMRRDCLHCLDEMVTCGRVVITADWMYQDELSCLRIFDALPDNLRTAENMAQLRGVNGKEVLFQAVVEDVSKKLCRNDGDGDASMDFRSLLRYVSRYVKVFNIETDAFLLELCGRSDDFTLLYNTAKMIYENCTDVDKLCKVSTLVLQSIGTDTELGYATLMNDTLVMDDAGMPIDEDIMMKCLEMARCTSAKAVLHSDGSPKVLEVCAWASLTSGLTKGGHNRSLLHGPESKVATINSFRTTFEMYSAHLSNTLQSTKTSYLTYLSAPMTEISADMNNAVVAHVERCLQGMFCENNAWTALKLLSYLYTVLPTKDDPQLRQKIEQNFYQCRSKLVTKAFAAKHIDQELLFLLLCSYPWQKARKVAHEALIVHCNNLEKFEAILAVGVKLTRRHNGTDHFGPMMLATKFWKSIRPCSMTFKEFSKMFTENKCQLLDTLISNQPLTLQQVGEYCHSFNLTAEVYYVKYLHSVLSTWHPAYTVQSDGFGKRCLRMECNHQENDLITRCMSIVKAIANRAAVLDCISRLWKTTNFYYYEVYFTLLHVMTQLEESGAGDSHNSSNNVLQFLKNYTRVSAPTMDERDEWLKHFAFDSFESLAEWRFPFSPRFFSADIWRLLRHEINLCNYREWFQLAGTLEQLDRDEICSFVIRELVFHSAAGAGSYSRQAQFAHVFVEIDKCLECIRNPSLAVSVAYHLIGKTPDGVDRVFATKLAYKYSRILASNKDEQDMGMRKKIEKLYHQCLSKDILYAYDLASEEYLRLLSNPEELISALYNDERIVDGSVTRLLCPQINKATDELGALFQYDIKSKRMQLMQMWLRDNAFVGDANQSIYLAPDVPDVSSDDNTHSVRRAVYLCSGDDVAMWRDYLCTNVLENNGDFLYQARALQTYCCITSKEEVASKWDASYTSILNFIERFFLLHDFHTLAITIDQNELELVDKPRMLRKLGRNMNNPMNVKTMANMCYVYNIYTIDAWENIINAMINHEMWSELKHAVKAFQRHGVHFRRPFFVRAWQTIIDNTFTMLADSNQKRCGDEIDKALATNIIYIQSSPVLSQLDVTIAYRGCVRCKQYAFAVLLFQYMSDAVRRERLEDILRNINRQDLISSVQKQLTGKGLKGIQYICKLLCNMEQK